MLVDKTKLRKEFRQLRRSLTPEQQQKARIDALQNVLNNQLLNDAEDIAFYLSQDGELSCKEIINWCWQNNRKTYLPVLDPNHSHHLLFIRYAADTQMCKNQFNISEPLFDLSKTISVEQLDTIFMPLVSFDETGNRLGMGGGYYDRTLANLRSKQTKPKLYGFAHDCQQSAALNSESWDIPVNKIITPSRIISI